MRMKNERFLFDIDFIYIRFISKLQTKMLIRVTATSIDAETFHAILNYYNTNKPKDDEPLERLNRAEGGFQIQIASKRNLACDDNLKIRQLRWSRGRLVSCGYIGFTAKQEAMMYEALVHGLGRNVLMEM